MTVENGVPETVQTGEIPTWMHCVFTEVNIPPQWELGGVASPDVIVDGTETVVVNAVNTRRTGNTPRWFEGFRTGPGRETSHAASIWATRDFQPGPVSGQTRSRCPAGRSLLGCPPARGCGSLSVCSPSGTVTRRGSRRDCPARSSNAHLAVHIGTSTGGSSTWSRSSSGSIPTSCRPRSRSSTTTTVARLWAVPHRPGRLHGDADVCEGVAGPGLGCRGRQRGRAAVGAAAAGGRRACRRRPGQARRPGPALRHRSQPQDRRPGRALDRDRRGAHHHRCGCCRSTASSRRCGCSPIAAKP